VSQESSASVPPFEQIP
jgi:hypothetical protein